MKILLTVSVTLILLLPNLYHPIFAESHLDVEKKPEIIYNQTGKYYEIYHQTPSENITLVLSENKIIFNLIPRITGNGTVTSFDMSLKPELKDLYSQVGFPTKSNNVIFVYPVFTQAAYGKNGFYDYYNKKCDASCLTIDIPSSFSGTYSSSIVSSYVLNMLNYSFITDVDVDKNPQILQKYDTVIILHNEYVTKNEFNAITNHPHVIYLYSNALFAEVRSNYTDNTIKLIKGHGYPNETIQNGFDWKNDNTKFEYDLKCTNWNFIDIDNGKMLNCYPDYAMLYDKNLLHYIKEQSIQSVPEFDNVIFVIITSMIAVLLLNKFKMFSYKITKL